jgi:hypothetical protein
MSDYVRRLEAELVRAGRRRHRFRTGHLPGGVSRITVGGVLAGFGAAAGVAVVILAIALLGHTRPRVADQPAPVPAGAGSLRAQLAVLRRPQTGADRAGTTAVLGTMNVSANLGQQIKPDLTRLMAILPATGSARSSGQHERVFLIVASPTRSARRPAGARRPVASIATVSTPKATGAGAAPTAVFYTRATAFPTSGGGYETAIVPDDVARVRWNFDGQNGRAGPRRPTTVFAAIRDNLAYAPASRDQGQVTRVTWYGANGQILRTMTGPHPQSTLVYRAPAHGRAVAPLPKNVKILAQINLRPPSTNHHGRSGIATVFRQARTLGVNLVAHGLAPNTKHNAYAVWLYRSPSKNRLLGFVDPAVSANGLLKAAGALPSNANHYDRILITRETNHRPTAPGPIILEGRLSGI